MSAIFGVCYHDGRLVNPACLESMAEALAQRGPDATGQWRTSGIGLGHRLLRTTPESLGERLPLVSDSADLVVTADARIDNRDELMALLDMPGRDIADSELILAAYERWGALCPARLLGDFAFAIWDGRSQKLFCARDHFGVKPFYFYRSESCFAFASEIKALFCVPEVPRELNELRVGDYLVPMFEDKTITFYRDILRLPPAHCMAVDRNGTEQSQYWTLEPAPRLQFSSDQAYADAFREVFTEAVRCRMRSASPVGSMLSGGLDSSSITCVARGLLAGDGRGRLHTFSALHGDVPECDERPFIDAVLAQGGFEPHREDVDRLGPLADLDRLVTHQDEPFYCPNLYVHSSLYRVAQQHGVRVLLDGFDGDTTVSHGAGFLVELMRAGRWVTLTAELRGLATHFNRPFWRLWTSFFMSYGLRRMEPLRQSVRDLRGHGRPGWCAENSVISAGFAQRIALEERFQRLGHPGPTRLKQTEAEDHCNRLSSGVLPFTLEVIDRTAGSFSLETRFPFFDKRLVEFCLALPPEQKIRRGWTRLVMRRAMAGVLPEEVQWRDTKSDGSLAFNQGLLTFGRELLDRLALGGYAEIRTYIDMPALRTTYQRYLSTRANEDALILWKALTLALWLRRTGLAAEGETTDAGRHGGVVDDRLTLSMAGGSKGGWGL